MVQSSLRGGRDSLPNGATNWLFPMHTPPQPVYVQGYQQGAPQYGPQSQVLIQNSPFQFQQYTPSSHSVEPPRRTRRPAHVQQQQQQQAVPPRSTGARTRSQQQATRPAPASSRPREANTIRNATTGSTQTDRRAGPRASDSPQTKPCRPPQQPCTTVAERERRARQRQRKSDQKRLRLAASRALNEEPPSRCEYCNGSHWHQDCPLVTGEDRPFDLTDNQGGTERTGEVMEMEEPEEAGESDEADGELQAVLSGFQPFFTQTPSKQDLLERQQGLIEAAFIDEDREGNIFLVDLWNRHVTLAARIRHSRHDRSFWHNLFIDGC